MPADIQLEAHGAFDGALDNYYYFQSGKKAGTYTKSSSNWSYKNETAGKKGLGERFLEWLNE
jgi:hypothetical protein